MGLFGVCGSLPTSHLRRQLDSIPTHAVYIGPSTRPFRGPLIAPPTSPAVSFAVRIWLECVNCSCVAPPHLGAISQGQECPLPSLPLVSAYSPLNICSVLPWIPKLGWALLFSASLDFSRPLQWHYLKGRNPTLFTFKLPVFTMGLHHTLVLTDV